MSKSTEKIVGTTPFEKFVKKNFHKMDNHTMAKKWGCSVGPVRTQAYKLGLYRMRLEYWTDEQITFLKANYQTTGDKELAIIFNERFPKNKKWTIKHIEKKRNYLNLHRTKEQLKEIKTRNIVRGCWREMSTWKTRHAAPDGTIKTWNGLNCKWQFKVIKVDNHYLHYAKWLYEKHYGPMPTGHIVGFKDRNNLNVVVENLEAITRAEHSRRNSERRRAVPEEFKEANKILNQLLKTINIKQNGKERQFSKETA